MLNEDFFGFTSFSIDSAWLLIRNVSWLKRIAYNWFSISYYILCVIVGGVSFPALLAHRRCSFLWQSQLLQLEAHRIHALMWQYMFTWNVWPSSSQIKVNFEGMISCDMLVVLCYLWIYSNFIVALSLSKTLGSPNPWSILLEWVSSHEAKGSNSDTWIRFKRLASFRKGDIFWCH